MEHYLHRVHPNKTTRNAIHKSYDAKGRLVDGYTHQPLKDGQIDIGHKAGYEEKVMRRAAEKLHYTQKEYNNLMQDGRLYVLQDRYNNRSGKYEAKNFSDQLHNCMQVIRANIAEAKQNGQRSDKGQLRGTQTPGRQDPHMQAKATVPGHGRANAAGKHSGALGSTGTGHSAGTGGRSAGLVGGQSAGSVSGGHATLGAGNGHASSSSGGHGGGHGSHGGGHSR